MWFRCGLVFALLVVQPAAAENNVERIWRELEARIADPIELHTTFTRGRVAETIQAAIDRGAPLYNGGAHGDTYEIYALIVKTILERSRDAPGDSTRRMLVPLREAARRSEGYASADRKAWALRFGFDAALLEWSADFDRVASWVALGDQYFKRAQYEEAAAAFERAADLIDELVPSDSQTVALDYRLAPLALGHAHFALHDFELSAQAIQRGLRLVPDWPSYQIDRAAFHRDRKDYDRAFAALEARAGDPSASADVQFLLGYEYYLAGRHEDGRQQFERALETDPEHAGARLFLDHDRDQTDSSSSTGPAV